MNKIKITRSTIVKGQGAVDAGKELKVGKDVSDRDALYLVRIGKAVEVAQRAKPVEEEFPKETPGAEEKAPAGEGESVNAESEELNPLIAKAMDLAGVESVAELQAFSDEELRAVNGIGDGMVKAIRKVFEE
jgi:hypothetical protein